MPRAPTFILPIGCKYHVEKTRQSLSTFLYLELDGTYDLNELQL